MMETVVQGDSQATTVRESEDQDSDSEEVIEETASDRLRKVQRCHKQDEP